MRYRKSPPLCGLFLFMLALYQHHLRFFEAICHVALKFLLDKTGFLIVQCNYCFARLYRIRFLKPDFNPLCR